jgi:hypothetical protein
MSLHLPGHKDKTKVGTEAGCGHHFTFHLVPAFLGTKPGYMRALGTSSCLHVKVQPHSEWGLATIHQAPAPFLIVSQFPQLFDWILEKAIAEKSHKNCTREST